MTDDDGLPKTGFVRLSSVLAPKGPIPVSRSTWYAGVKSGRYPKPIPLGPATSAYDVQAIRNLIARLKSMGASLLFILANIPAWVRQIRALIENMVA